MRFSTADLLISLFAYDTQSSLCGLDCHQGYASRLLHGNASSAKSYAGQPHSPSHRCVRSAGLAGRCENNVLKGADANDRRVVAFGGQTAAALSAVLFAACSCCGPWAFDRTERRLFRYDGVQALSLQKGLGPCGGKEAEKTSREESL